MTSSAMNSITLVGISDLHGHLPDLNKLPNGDVLCICGDIVPLDVQNHFRESISWLGQTFLPWVEDTPYDHVILIGGNHDKVLDTVYTETNVIREMLVPPTKLYYLMDSGIEIDGWNFWGTPWCPHLKNWAFYACHDELVEKFSDIPDDTDILLTHCAPKIMDYGVSLDHIGLGRVDYGCQELAEAIKEKKPKVNLFGHIHSGDHRPKEIEGTTYCNVSLLNEMYRPTFKPTVLTINK